MTTREWMRRVAINVGAVVLGVVIGALLVWAARVLVVTALLLLATAMWEANRGRGRQS